MTIVDYRHGERSVTIPDRQSRFVCPLCKFGIATPLIEAPRDDGLEFGFNTNVMVSVA